MSTVSQYFGATNLFIGLKWTGHGWMKLSTGQLVKHEGITWCPGNPQGKSLSASDSFIMEISFNTSFNTSSALLLNKLKFTLSIW